MRIRARLGRYAAIVAFAVMFVGVAGGTALAGGPTSVLLVSPGMQRTAALYYSDADYQTLTDVVGVDSSVPATAATGSQGVGDYISVTWLIHDVSIWRIDRIYPNAPDGPWIATVLFDGSVPGVTFPPPGSAGDDKAVWHRPTNPSALQSLLGELGLVGSATPVEAGPSSSVAAVAPARSASTVTSSLEQSSPGWVWGVGGALVGAVVAVAALRLGRVRRVGGVPDGGLAGETYIDLDHQGVSSRPR